MSDDALAKVSRVLDLLKLIGGLLAVSGLAIGTGFVWISQTTAALAADQITISKMEAERKARTDEWTMWRTRKDEIDVRLITTLDNIQRSQDRTLDRLERLEARGAGK